MWKRYLNKKLKILVLPKRQRLVIYKGRGGDSEGIMELRIQIQNLVAVRASLEELFVHVSFHLRVFNFLPQSVGFLNQGLGVKASLCKSFHPVCKKRFLKNVRY